jgi:hypothetical protein
VNTVYIYNHNIRFWEGTKTVNNEHLATLSIVQDNTEHLYAFWNSVIPDLNTVFLSSFRWSTVGSTIESKVQELKFLKKSKKYLGDKDTQKKNNKNIYLTVHDVASYLNDIDLNNLTCYTRAILIFSTLDISTDNAWDYFSIMGERVDIDLIVLILIKNPHLVIVRLYEDDDTHVALQFMGKNELVNKIKDKLDSEDIQSIKEDCIADHINGCHLPPSQTLGVSYHLKNPFNS